MEPGGRFGRIHGPGCGIRAHLHHRRADPGQVGADESVVHRRHSELGRILHGRLHEQHRLDGVLAARVAATGQGFGYATPIPVMSKWFPDKRGLAVGLAVAGYGGGSAIFGPLGGNWLIPAYRWRNTFFIFGIIFFCMGMIATWLLQNPKAGYKPAGWVPSPGTKAPATKHDFAPSEVVRTRDFYFLWVAYALGTSAGLMVISQLVPFA
jgi:hypothetical protein